MTSNFLLNANNLSIDKFINMNQNNVINLSLPMKESDFSSKKYVDEKTSNSANSDKIIVNSSNPNKETVQQALEKLANEIKGLLPKSGGTMN